MWPYSRYPYSLISLRWLIILMADYITAQNNAGYWELLVSNAGVSAMHMILMPSNKVVIFDRTDFGPSNISLAKGACRIDPDDIALQVDCWAHSIEYDIASNSVRPLTILTDTWCSSGGLDADGNLLQTGGFNDGARVVRQFQDCTDCNWQEYSGQLAVNRWYASNQILPDNRFIVVGGRRQFNYEFVPKAAGDLVYKLPFLADTKDEVENNLYPFVHLSSDGNLFIFANSASILLDYKSNTVVKRFPDMPGGEAHNYPSSGSSVMLPLDAADNFQGVEIMVCGGALPYSNVEANAGNFLLASQNCGRLKITDPFPEWKMETMPIPRVMGDMLLLPSGDVLIINGAQKGTAGWGVATDPALWPVFYIPDGDPSNRFAVLNSTGIPRLYHSTAILIPDGRILIGGGNPHVTYNFTDPIYPTQLSMEAFSPPYLDPVYDYLRPRITFISEISLHHGACFHLHFAVENLVDEERIQVNMLAPPFTTHSYAMNQRMLRLRITRVEVLPKRFRVFLEAPPSAIAAPAGYYMIFVVQAGIPSSASWIRIKN
eukprot:c13854_g1_i1 orf=190-1824(-)